VAWAMWSIPIRTHARIEIPMNLVTYIIQFDLACALVLVGFFVQHYWEELVDYFGYYFRLTSQAVAILIVTHIMFKLTASAAEWVVVNYAS